MIKRNIQKGIAPCTGAIFSISLSKFHLIPSPLSKEKIPSFLAAAISGSYRILYNNTVKLKLLSFRRDINSACEAKGILIKGIVCIKINAKEWR